MAEAVKYLRYVGQSHYRKLSKADFSKINVDHDKVELAGESARARLNDRSTPSVGVFSEDAAIYLLANEPDEWKEVDEEEYQTNMKETGHSDKLAKAKAEAEQENLESTAAPGSGDQTPPDSSGASTAGAAAGTAGATATSTSGATRRSTR